MLPNKYDSDSSMGNDGNEACDTRLTLGLATSDHHKNVTCLDLSIVPLHFSDHGTNKINGSSSKTCKSCSKFNSENKKIGMSKKLRLTKEQSTLLEDSFKHHTTLAMVSLNILRVLCLFGFNLYTPMSDLRIVYPHWYVVLC